MATAPKAPMSARRRHASEQPPQAALSESQCIQAEGLEFPLIER